MTTDEKALWTACLAAPADAAPKLVLADWLRERDRDPDLERGLRWCAEYGKWPCRERPELEEWTGDGQPEHTSPMGAMFVWYTPDDADAGPPGAGVIEDVGLVAALAAAPGKITYPGTREAMFNQLISRTAVTAIRRLGRALARLEAARAP